MPSSSLRNVLADDTETFSTPPTTPAAWTALNGQNGHGHGHKGPLQPSLSRKSSRPSSLHIERSQPEYKLNIEVETTSPPPPDQNYGSLNGNLPVKPPPGTMLDESTTYKKTPTVLAHQAAQSPCFVHSYLDKAATLTSFLKHRPDQANGDVGVARSLQSPGLQPSGPMSPESVASSWAGSSTFEDDEDDYTGNLTTRLAETAVGVREMSKQLGKPVQPPSAILLLTACPSRPRSCTIEHSTCSRRYESPRQPADKAHARAGSLSHAKAEAGEWAGPRSVRFSQLVTPLAPFNAWNLDTSMLSYVHQDDSMRRGSNEIILDSLNHFLDEDQALTGTLLPPPKAMVRRKVSFGIGPVPCARKVRISSTSL